MLRVHVQAAGAAHHQQADVRAAEDVAQVLQGRAVLGQGVLGPGAEGVDDHIETLQVGGGQVIQILLNDLRGLCPVPAPDHRGHIQAPAQGLLDDQLTGLAIGAYHCDFHFRYLLFLMAFCLQSLDG